MTTIHRGEFTASGDVKGLLSLFAPLFLIAFSNYLFLLIEKLLLVRLSVVAMEASVTTAYACYIFQGSLVALAMMAQVCVGRWYGEQKWELIGPGIWQFVWFSLLSMAFVLPAGFLYGNYYFQGTAIEEIAFPYYRLLLISNFLYPLSAVLSCFYLGQGKTKIVVILTITMQTLKLLLGYLLILGLDPWIPSVGIMGGAISTVVAHTFFCAALFFLFLHKNNHQLFHSWEWRFKPKFCWECIYPGLLRLCNRLLNFTSWAAIARMMAERGGNYQLFLSLGGALFLFLPLFGEALSQAQVTIIANLLGNQKYQLLYRATRSALLLILVTVFLLAFPFLLYPEQTFRILFPNIVISFSEMKHLLFGIWLSFCFSFVVFVPISDILSFKDMKFSFFMGCFNWINGYLLIRFALNTFNMPADYFWICLSIMHGSTAAIYFWRSYVLRARLAPPLDPKTKSSNFQKWYRVRSE